MNNNPALSETHHAILFALMAKYIFQFAVENKGRATVRKVVKRYGEQRGLRMAMRAKADNRDLTFIDYLIYGEWVSSDPSAMISEIKEHDQDLQTSISRCPWYSAWVANDLLEFGRLYCQEIDNALVKGFNPQLNIEVSQTMTNQGESCKFIYCDALMGEQNALSTVNEQRIKSKGKNTMPWEYHCGHLLKTFTDIACEELGEDGQRAIKAALDDFSERFGVELTSEISKYRFTDFNNLPSQ